MGNVTADRLDRIQWWVIWGIRVSLLFAAVGAVYFARWNVFFVSATIFILTFFTLYVEKKYDIELPLEFEVVIIVFLYASLFLGEVHGYYTVFWWWDALLHTASGFALGFIGFLIMYILNAKTHIQASPWWLVLFAFCFAMAMGAVWEIFEFAMDQIFGMNMQKSGLIDTMWDLIVDAIGAFITCLVGYYYLKGNKSPLFHRFMRKFLKENPRLAK